MSDDKNYCNEHCNEHCDKCLPRPRRDVKELCLIEDAELEDVIARSILYAVWRFQVVNLFRYNTKLGTPKDVVYEALYKILEGTRAWPQEESLFDCLCSIVNSDISNFLNSAEKKHTNYFISSDEVVHYLKSEFNFDRLLDLTKGLQKARKEIQNLNDSKMLLMFDALVLFDGDMMDAFDHLNVDRKNSKKLQAAYYLVRKIQNVVDFVEH